MTQPVHHVRVANGPVSSTARPVPVVGGSAKIVSDRYRGVGASPKLLVPISVADARTVLVHGWCQVVNDGSTVRNLSIGVMRDENIYLGQAHFTLLGTDMGGVEYGTVYLPDVLTEAGYHKYEFLADVPANLDITIHGHIINADVGPIMIIEPTPSPIEHELESSDVPYQEYSSGNLVRIVRMTANWSPTKTDYGPEKNGDEYDYSTAIWDWNFTLVILPKYHGIHLPDDHLGWQVFSGPTFSGRDSSADFYFDPAIAGISGFTDAYLKTEGPIEGGVTTVSMSKDGQNWTTVGSGVLPRLTVTQPDGTSLGVPNEISFRTIPWPETDPRDVLIWGAKITINGNVVLEEGYL